MEHVERIKPGPKMIDGWYVGEGDFPSRPLERLVYFARLAPSSHNSQPWKFVIGEAEIDLFANPDRWQRAADRDRREMFVSLGCALESLRIAADFAGYGTAVRYFPVAGDEMLVARVAVAKGGPKRDGAAGGLLQHMLTRHTSHRLFDPSRPVSEADKKALYDCFQIGEVALHTLHERALLDALAALELRADAALLADPQYRAELARWAGEGVFGTSRLRSKLRQFVIGHLPVGRSVGQEDAQRLASAPLLGILTTRADRRIDQIQAGEAYLRLALVAERHELRVQPISQVLEVPETRAEVAQVCGLGERVAQHIFRIGCAPPETFRSKRLPLESIVIRADRPA